MFIGERTPRHRNTLHPRCSLLERALTFLPVLPEFRQERRELRIGSKSIELPVPRVEWVARKPIVRRVLQPTDRLLTLAEQRIRRRNVVRRVMEVPERAPERE